MRKLQPSNGRAAKRLIMRRSQPSSGNGGSCDLGGAGGDGGSGGGDGGSGGVSCGLEAIRCQCSVAIDPGDAALQACKVGMQVSSWLLPPSPAPGKDIAKRLRDTLLLSRWVLERVGPRRESWGWDRSCTSAPVEWNCSPSCAASIDARVCSRRAASPGKSMASTGEGRVCDISLTSPPFLLFSLPMPSVS